MPKRQPHNIVGTVGLIPPWKRNANRWATGETMVHLGRPAYCPRPPRSKGPIKLILWTADGGFTPLAYSLPIGHLKRLVGRAIRAQRRAKRGG